MIQITRWGPDTCNCVLEYQWNDSDLIEDRQHTLSRVVNKCIAHREYTDEIVFSMVTDENKRKNIVLNEIFSNTPSLMFVNNEGKVIYDEKNVNWQFDQNRKLIISTNLKSTEKTKVKNLLKNKFKINEVEIL